MVTCLVDFLLALFLFFSYLAFSSSLRVRQQDDLRVPITVLSALTASPFHFPFLLYLSLHSLGQHLPTPRHYHAAAIRSLFHLFLAFPLCTYTYSIQLPSPAPPRSPLLYKLVLADEAAHILVRSSGSLSLFSFHFYSPACSPRLGDCPVELLSTRSLSVSRACLISVNTHTYSLSLFSLVPLSLILGRHFHPHSTYLRYTTSQISSWPIDNPYILAPTAPSAPSPGPKITLATKLRISRSLPTKCPSWTSSPYPIDVHFKPSETSVSRLHVIPICSSSFSGCQFP
ncbi:hypothetical protein V8E52_012040 [Russula decolorans]